MSLKALDTRQVLDYYAQLVEPESDFGSVGYSEASLKARLLATLQTLEGVELVDLGSGPNPVVSFALAKDGKKVTCVELSSNFCDHIARNAGEFGVRVDVVCASVHETGLPDAAFDLAVLSEVLEHVPNELEGSVLREARRILRPHGRLVISVPNLRSAFHYWQRIRSAEREEHPQHLRDYTHRILHERLHEAGFRVERTLRVPASVGPFAAGRSAWLLDRTLPFASLSLKVAFVARAR